MLKFSLKRLQKKLAISRVDRLKEDKWISEWGNRSLRVYIKVHFLVMAMGSTLFIRLDENVHPSCFYKILPSRHKNIRNMKKHSLIFPHYVPQER